MKNIELLAPVGSFDSLKAAVQNGANAVFSTNGATKTEQPQRKERFQT